LRKSFSFAAAATIVALAPPIASFQQTAESRMALVTVTDAQNRTIVDVETDDFQIDENGQPREVFEARIADYPIVVLVDDSAGASEELETIRSAAARFIVRMGERPVAIATMASPPAIVASFEDDRATVLARLETLEAGTAPLAPLEAFAEASRLLHDVGAPFSAVVVVASQPFASTEPEPPGLLTALLERRTFVHVVERRPTSVPAASGAPRAGDGDLLRDVAVRTGGQMTAVYSPVSYAVALDGLADRLAAEFVIEYLVPAGSSAGGDVRVGVRIPGVRVRGLGVFR
jgi:hypothetical protein